MGAMRRFWGDLVGAYADGVRAMAGLWPLFVVLIGWEFAQHVAEVRIGFYASRAAAHAVSNDGSRMALGWVKMISVYAGGFLVIRWLSREQGRAPGPVGAAARYLPYAAYSLVLFAAVFYAPRFVPAAGVNAWRTLVSLAQIAVEPLLMPWIVSAATDGVVRGPVDSARRIGSGYPRALALFFAGRLPVNAMHGLLGLGAIGQRAAVMWAMLTLDAVSVGLLIAVIPALYVRIARSTKGRARVADGPSAQPA